MKRLRELREQRRLTQGGLALKLSVSQSTLSAYEVGERTPDLATLIAIANFFGVSLDYLVGLSNIKQPVMQSGLMPDEIDNLYLYRQIRLLDQEKVRAYIDSMLGK